MLLNEHSVEFSRVYFAGGHPNVIQAVWDGKAVGGAAFYSPPGETQAREGTLVGDARMLLLSRMPDIETRRKFLDEVRIVALSNPIPNDLCAARAGFSEDLWERFEQSFRKFLATPAGQEAYFDLVAGVDAASVDDSHLRRLPSGARELGHERRHAAGGGGEEAGAQERSPIRPTRSPSKKGGRLMPGH